MIRLVIKKGVQQITEVCDTCKCHVRNLTTDDILVKRKTDLIIKNSKGEEVTRTKLNRPECKCNDCND
jgi:ssDNA-binding replication factor A large subunit